MAFRKIKPCRGAPTSHSQTYIGRKVILYHESRDLVGFLRGKPQLSGKPKLHWDSYTQDIPLRLGKTRRTSRRVDDPDKRRVSQSQDTTDELDIGMAKPLGDQWGPGHRSGGTNTHEEHWPGLLIKFLGVAIPYADYY